MALVKPARRQAGPLFSSRFLKWKQYLLVLYYGLKDPRTPFYSKLPALLSIAYLLSPIDLIPDFIPLVGWIDDLIIVPLLLQISVRLLPSRVREDSRLKAARNAGKLKFALIILVLMAILILIGMIYLIKRMFGY